MQRIQVPRRGTARNVDTIWHVALAPQQEVSFKPGQYLLVVMSDSDKAPLSIANSPTRSGVLELQIGATPENAYAGQVLATCASRRDRGRVGAGKRSCATNPLTADPDGGRHRLPMPAPSWNTLIGSGSKASGVLLGVRQAHWLYELEQMQQWGARLRAADLHSRGAGARERLDRQDRLVQRPSWMTSSACMTTTSHGGPLRDGRCRAEEFRCWAPSLSASSAMPTSLV